MKAFPAMWRTFKVLYDELFLWVWLSVLWWVGTVLVLPAGPVAAGLHAAANRSANYKRVDADFFWDGAKNNIGRSWLLVGANLLLLVAIVMNIVFYGNSLTTWSRLITILWLWVIVLVMMGGQYLLPLFWQQDDPSLRLIFRNAFILALQHPLYTLLMLLFQLTLIGVSFATVLPIFLLMPASVAVAANVGLVKLLEDKGLAPPPPPGV
ncbi:MAG: hypothetical protein KJZ86_14505 [Caldilineaceae bacterium]|nr:hypothetical protein [Caldilineaceae bacterium]HRJ45266.1 hypothetical protein [Caldilineaceae bacterium]